MRAHYIEGRIGGVTCRYDLERGVSTEECRDAVK